jgi:hypothetical protein
MTGSTRIDPHTQAVPECVADLPSNRVKFETPKYLPDMCRSTRLGPRLALGLVLGFGFRLVFRLGV